ncbi:hypothetical protein SEVIR_2G228166v4 [Setaria viridis]
MHVRPGRHPRHDSETRSFTSGTARGRARIRTRAVAVAAASRLAAHRRSAGCLPWCGLGCEVEASGSPRALVVGMRGPCIRPGKGCAGRHHRSSTEERRCGAGARWRVRASCARATGARTARSTVESTRAGARPASTCAAIDRAQARSSVRRGRRPSSPFSPF